MQLDSLSQLAGSQGPVFWVASGAIALGATFLVTALGLLLRRSIAARLAAAPRRGGATAVPAGPASAGEADPPAAAAGHRAGAVTAAWAPQAVVGTARSGFETGVAGMEAPAPARGESLVVLLRRLQAAGDRLEEIAADLRDQPASELDSFLKDDLEDVEYVFKASGP